MKAIIAHASKLQTHQVRYEGTPAPLPAPPKAKPVLPPKPNAGAPNCDGADIPEAGALANENAGVEGTPKGAGDEAGVPNGVPVVVLPNKDGEDVPKAGAVLDPKAGAAAL